jgi:hypothetical protein
VSLTEKAGVTVTYRSANQKHAVISTSAGSTFSHDANGNRTTRTVGGETYDLSYNAENRFITRFG